MRVDPLDALKRGHAKFWMFLVGINDYDDERLCSLNFAVADCQGFATALNAVTELFPKREILVHCGTQHQPFAIAQMQSRLDRLFDPTDGVQPEDTVLFYFAGHGAVDPITQQLYLCLSATQLHALPETGLNLQTLLERLQAAKVGKQVFVLDACHCDKVEFFNAQLEAALHLYATQRREFYALLSCSGIGQQSWEFADLGHGVFTHYLIEGLRGAAIDEQGQVDVDQLYRYVRDQTELWVRNSLGKSQIPSHIKSGCRDIVIGVQPPEDQSLVQEIGSLSEREKRYRQAVWQALKQSHPLPPSKLDQLRNFADELLLPKESIHKIETDEIQSFKRDLENYKQRAISILHQQYPHDFDLFSQLRQKIGFSAQVLAPLEGEAFEVFQQHKRSYQAYVSHSYCQSNILQPASYQKLQKFKQKYDLDDQVARSLEVEVLDVLNQQKLFYRSLLLMLITEHSDWNRELRKQLGQTQAKLGFSNAVIAAIEQEAIATIPPSEIPPTFVPLSAQRSPRATVALTVATLGTLSTVALIHQQQYQTTAATHNLHDQRSQRDRIASLKGNHQYQACIQAAIAVPQTSAFYTETQEFHHQCRIAETRATIAKAKQFAKQGRFQAAIALSSKISQEDEVALEVRKLINTWAQAIWKVAKKHYDKGELRPAIAMLKAIPKSASVYAEKQNQVQEWQQDWERNRSYLENAKQARASGEWGRVIQKGKKIQHPYWKQQAKPLIAEAKLAQQASRAERKRSQTAPVMRVAKVQRKPQSEMARMPEFSNREPGKTMERVATVPKAATPEPSAGAGATLLPKAVAPSVSVKTSPIVPSPVPTQPPVVVVPTDPVRTEQPRAAVASRTGQPQRPPEPSPQIVQAPRTVIVQTELPKPQVTPVPEYSRSTPTPAVERQLPRSPIPPGVASPSRSAGSVVVPTIEVPARPVRMPLQEPEVARRPSAAQTLLSSRLKTLSAKRTAPKPQWKSAPEAVQRSSEISRGESLGRPSPIEPTISSPKRSVVPEPKELIPEPPSFQFSQLPKTDESLPPSPAPDWKSGSNRAKSSERD